GAAEHFGTPFAAGWTNQFPGGGKRARYSSFDDSDDVWREREFALVEQEIGGVEFRANRIHGTGRGADRACLEIASRNYPRDRTDRIRKIDLVERVFAPDQFAGKADH